MPNDSADLTPWRVKDAPPVPPERYRALVAAPLGWYAVRWWAEDDSAPELIWEPLIGWAIRRDPHPGHRLEQDDLVAVEPDDEIVPLERFDWREVAPLGYLDDGRHVLGFFTEGERADETLLARLRVEAHRRHIAAMARVEEEQRADREVQAFVAAQPDPAAFAAAMRAAGASSLRHAWAAITVSDGDPARAITLARRAYALLYDAHQRRTRSR